MIHGRLLAPCCPDDLLLVARALRNMYADGVKLPNSESYEAFNNALKQDDRLPSSTTSRATNRVSEAQFIRMRDAAISAGYLRIERGRYRHQAKLRQSRPEALA